MRQGVGAAAIRAQSIPLSLLDEAFLNPFVQEHHAIPPEQHPAFAPLMNTSEALKCYRFTRGGDDGELTIGYAIVKLRYHILANVYFGPMVLRKEDYTACIDALKTVLRRSGHLILRVMPPIHSQGVTGHAASFNWATQIVDISRPREKLIRSFSVNHRQSIQKAMAAGIIVKPLPAQDTAAWLKGYLGMFHRRGIVRDEAQAGQAVRGMMALTLEPDSPVFIRAAYLPDGVTLAGGGIFLCSGDTCTYYKGFTEKLSPALPVLHLLLLEAMLEAASRGCTRFDLYGYSLNPDAQLRAINDFKRWFRGELLEYPRTVLLPLYPFAAPLIRLLRRKGRL